MFAPWIGGVLGILLLLWGLSSAIERMVFSPASSGGSTAGAPPGQLLPNSATAHLDVKVLDENGKEYPLGTPIPRQLSLTMLNTEGQEFLVPFDRVGVWAVDAPDGQYSVPAEQKKLGNWSWKISGAGVKLDKASRAWLVTLKREGQPVVLGITLY
jgi:hypothetical protein